MKYLVIIQPNYPGLLAEATSLLEKSAVDIEDFSGQSVGDMAVICIRAQPYQKAFKILAEAGFRVVSNDHLLVRLKKYAGALADLSRRLADAQVDVSGMHIVARSDEQCIVALETADHERARAALADLVIIEPSGPE